MEYFCEGFSFTFFNKKSFISFENLKTRFSATGDFLFDGNSKNVTFSFDVMKEVHILEGIRCPTADRKEPNMSVPMSKWREKENYQNCEKTSSTLLYGDLYELQRT